MKTLILFIFNYFLYTILLTANSFTNLDFDFADTNHLFAVPPNPDFPIVQIGFTRDLLPGWTITSENRDVNAVYLNSYPLSFNFAAIYSSAFHARLRPSSSPYALFLYPGFDPFGSETFEMTIKQEGEISMSAQSLRFTIYNLPMVVKVNGNPLPTSWQFEPDMADLTDGLPWQWRRGEQIADLSSYAGQTVHLSFTTTDRDRDFYTVNGLDTIRFSSEPFPEPLAPARLLLGLLGWSAARRRR